MPVTPTYPGVYIEEIPSGVRTIVGVATSITAFIGIARRGPVNDPIRIQSFGDFERRFGGIWLKSAMSYAVQQYFLNGGSDALIVRVVHTGDEEPTNNATKGIVNVGEGEAATQLKLEAANEGAWSKDYVIRLDLNTASDITPGPTDTRLFNLFVEEITEEKLRLNDQGEPELDENGNQIMDVTRTAEVESFRNISTDPDSSRFVTKVLEQESDLIRVRATTDDDGVPDEQPALPSTTNGERPTSKIYRLSAGQDGAPPAYTTIERNNDVFPEYLGQENQQTGLYALEKADLFNLLCIPPRVRGTSVADKNDDNGQGLLAAALRYCQRRRAMLLVDPPSNWKRPEDVEQDTSGIRQLLRDKNATIYFPLLKLQDPRRENRLDEFPPSGALAGIMARTDSNRGVWKAPAGIDATLAGVRELSYKMTDLENGRLNPIGVNCLRSFPVYGNVVWGARTLDGADQLASEWKYIPVRRLALFLEESLYRGTQWVVFEPNDEPLWSQIRLNIGVFMNDLFRQGAFQGKTPREAYFVKCDRETTTQSDINRGIVNIIVGFAPLKPAEFVIIKFQQIAGQLAV
jgi:uncharacterized protein